ncbi:MAG TPA: class I SAM-dependent methyltransferase [Gammaproteobacteria bacterium]
MSGFSDAWLALREAADAAARSASLAASFAARLAAVRPADAPLEVVDLGAGTGANLRYLAPRLGGAQRWRLVDADPALAAAVEPRLREWADGADARVSGGGGGRLAVEGPTFACEIELVALDLARDLPRLPLPDGALVTASALLDLVSEAWLRALARRCRDAASPALFALTYDGAFECRPADDADGLARRRFNEHQRRDKGFGPALGPAAPAAARRAFAELGYHVTEARSDWRLGPAEGALAGALLDGWAAAAREVDAADADAIDAWHRRRREALAAGALELVVGHVDTAAWPPHSPP